MTREEFYELKRKMRYVTDGEFITLEVYKTFLKEHGYILSAYDGGGYINWDSKYEQFFPFREDYNPKLNDNLILVGNPEEWGDYIDRYYCKNIVNNSFVKYISTEFTTFRIYTIIENEDAKGTYFGPRDESLYCAKLEKDLSKEWIKYLVKVCPEFAEHLIERCEHDKKEAVSTYQYRKGLIAKKVAELKAEVKRLPIEREEEIKKNDDIILAVKEALNENLGSNV